MSLTTKVGFRMNFLTSLSDGNIGVCGRKGKMWKLINYNPLTGSILKDVSLDSEVRGMSSLKLGGRAVLAITYK